MTGIIDYGAGNLKNVKKALDFLQVESVISSEIEVLETCDRLILPGVGAFQQAMEMLREKKMDVFLKEYVKEKPLLGICLGMQLLFDSSEEFGHSEGLGLIPGKVVRLPKREGYKIPHMGWNNLSFCHESSLLKGVKEGEYVYFVHSYHAEVENEKHLIAVTDYGMPVTAIVQKDKIFGAQFHPEKSDQTGLAMLKNFCEQ